MNRHFITSVEYGCQYAHFYIIQPCSNFFSTAKNSCTKYPKNQIYRLISNISQRQTNGQTDREKETDGRILHKHVSLFCSGIIPTNAYLNVQAYNKWWMLPEQIFFRIGILTDLNYFIYLLMNTYKLRNTGRRSLQSNKNAVWPDYVHPSVCRLSVCDLVSATKPSAGLP
jgi:hypothetical protein